MKNNYLLRSLALSALVMLPLLLSAQEVSVNGLQAGTVRDLWRQENIPTDAIYIIPTHGVLYVKVQKPAGPMDLIPAPVAYTVLPGSIRSNALTQLPQEVILSEEALRRRLEGRELAPWQLKSAYWLEVGEKGVKMEAADEEGAFYARQTLNMIPAWAMK